MTSISIPLGDICRLITDGKHGDCKNEEDSGFFFISAKDIKDSRIHYENARQIVYEDFLETHRRTNLQPGDILLTNSGTIGRLAIAPDEEITYKTTFQKSVAILKPILELINSKYLYYFLLNKQTHLENAARGAAQKNLLLSELRRFNIQVPSKVVQNSIVSILSPYDDLIENNRRRIQLLEEAARLLYQEWFVRLRFPGHEHTKIVDGVPEGWRKSPLSELCELINYGYTESAVNEEIGPKFLRITDIVPSFINWDSVPYCKIEESKKEKFLLKEGDIVIARTGATVGYAKRINKRHPESVYASYLVRLRINSEIDNKIVGILLESDFYKEFVKSNISGAAQPNANAKVLTRFELLVAPKKIQQEFCDIISPILDQKEILQDLSQQLINARDLLLPRLMNGVIPV